MSSYNDILKKLRKTGALGLMEYRKLSRKEIDVLGGAISDIGVPTETGSWKN